MNILVRCSSEDSEQELRSLAAWLGADRTVRRSVDVELRSDVPSAPGHQGNGIDLLALVIGSGFNAASLAVSILAWRSTRPERPTLTVERPDGSVVRISGHSQEEAERLLRRVLGE
ncbi:effector-associated constant component EACC1 [Streptomyces sp. DSM 118878]